MHAGHHHHGHDHDHHHGSSGGWRYGAGIALNLAFVAIEAVFGFWSDSAALLADAGHNLSDVLGLALAGAAAWLAARGSGNRQRTYGFGKATVLAALINGLFLVFACGAIGWEAVRRIGEAAHPASGVIMAVAAAGVVINTATALLFLSGRKADANVRGAFLHMAADAAVSAGVIVAGALIWWTGAAWIDTAASLIIVAVILYGTWDLLKEALDLALDAAPRDVDVDAVRDFLAACPGVSSVHDLHVWPISTTETALTAHLVREGGCDDDFIVETTAAIHARFGIGHATLQVEAISLHGCQDMHA